MKLFLDDADQKSKIHYFVQNTKSHWVKKLVRDLVNQYKQSTDPNYCVRVTANDGEIGEQFLREFQDNEKNYSKPF